jgi:DNA-binding MarR family transcriptional regulator
MKELENLYNNHYKTKQMMDWSELTDKQKKALENSREYLSFQFNKALDDFKNDCQKEVEKLIEVVKRVFTNLKK